MASKVAIIGDRESIAGFKPLGIATFAVEDAREAGALLEELSAGDYAIIFLTEPLFEMTRPESTGQRGHIATAVVPVPPLKGPTGAGRAHLDHLFSLATGARPADPGGLS